MDPPRDRGRGLIDRPDSPFLIVNPRSGDSEPSAEELVEEAERRGIGTHTLGPDDDVAAIARKRAALGASALGMAGGDGSLAAVVGEALEHDLPFVCVPFGTRNHFARDLGLDCDDPVSVLDALGGGEERRVDVGLVDGRIFLNNVSLGLYASLVHDPAHETKNRLVAALRMIPATFGKSRRPLDLTVEVEGRTERRSALILLVANNDYALDAISDLGQRSRLDEGCLHAYIVEAVGRWRLVGLFAKALSGRIGPTDGWLEWTSRRFEVAAKRTRVHVAIDGEPDVLTPPLAFEIRPGALRVLVPAGTSSRDGGPSAAADN
ncbi:MAG: diacylglycerol/lipid kinase family protein [Gaiellaceae bacterium]